MANPVKGEVAFEVGGKVYTFVLGTYGLAALERKLQQPWPKIFARAGKGEFGVADILAVVHAGLLRHHRQLTEEQVADMIDEAGLDRINILITEATALMVPGGAAAQAEDKENPLKATNGAGAGTTSLPSGSP